eukprot:scaffold4201_cov119-Isochrysis_galbana.AAC.6
MERRTPRGSGPETGDTSSLRHVCGTICLGVKLYLVARSRASKYDAARRSGRALTPVGHPHGIAGPVNPCPASDSFPARCVRGSCSKTMDGSRQLGSGGGGQGDLTARGVSVALPPLQTERPQHQTKQQARRVLGNGERCSGRWSVGVR